MTKADVAIIGAGMAGFGTTYQLIAFDRYVERDRVGEHTCTYKFDNEFMFDDRLHSSFMQDKRFLRSFSPV
jgi:protoporphyrinogen oxidase